VAHRDRRGAYALRLADVERGQAVLMGTIREADVATIVVVRLKIARRRIEEVETLVIRNEAAAKSLDTIGTPRVAWSQPVPAAAGGSPARARCRQQFESGVFFYITRIRDRRFVLVDPERGLVFAFAFFDNGSGDARNGTLADGRYGMGSGWSTWAEAMSSDPR